MNFYARLVLNSLGILFGVYIVLCYGVPSGPLEVHYLIIGIMAIICSTVWLAATQTQIHIANLKRHIKREAK